MRYVDLYENAVYDLKNKTITLEEYDEITKPLRKEVDSDIKELETLVEVMKKRNRQVGHTDGWYMGGAVMINILERRIAELKGEEWVPEYEKAVEAKLKGDSE